MTNTLERQPSASSLTLRENFDAFVAAFEDEFRAQATKKNEASERRMRNLLRKFTKQVYEPYRDTTLGRNRE
ncbi:MAG: hypothetical protein WC965_01795 [Thiohalomonadaceae bacterium]